MFMRDDKIKELQAKLIFIVATTDDLYAVLGVTKVSSSQHFH